jgi:hypothetical protein
MKTKINKVLKVVAVIAFVVTLVLNVKASMDNPDESGLVKHMILAEETTKSATLPCADLYSWGPGSRQLRICMKNEEVWCRVEWVGDLDAKCDGTCTVSSVE